MTRRGALRTSSEFDPELPFRTGAQYTGGGEVPRCRRTRRPWSITLLLQISREFQNLSVANIRWRFQLIADLLPQLRAEFVGHRLTIGGTSPYRQHAVIPLGIRQTCSSWR